MAPPKPLQCVSFTFPPTDEPPNLSTSDHSSPKSFCDSLPDTKIPVDLKAKGLVSIEYIDNDRLKPKITIAPQLLEKLIQPWKQALIIKLLGRKGNVDMISLGYISLQNNVLDLWNPKGNVDMISIGNGFHVVRFENEGDRERVIKEGPWIIQGFYLGVRVWCHKFHVSDANVDYTMVWASFPGLPLMYYNEDVLMAVATAIGKVVCVASTKGCFARVCVEVDLKRSSIEQISVDGEVYRIEYDKLHFAPARCGGGSSF